MSPVCSWGKVQASNAESVLGWERHLRLLHFDPGSRCSAVAAATVSKKRKFFYDPFLQFRIETSKLIFVAEDETKRLKTAPFDQPMILQCGVC
jgi:hypothetical protein